MGDFAIVGEGFTEEIVLEAIILAYHSERAEEPEIEFEQPPLDKPGAKDSPAHGGWSLVVRYLRSREYLEALQLNRFIVIHVDADIASDLGVVRPHSVSDEDFIELIVRKLCSHIDPDDLDCIRDRLLFAIGFDEIECWIPVAIVGSRTGTVAEKTSSTRPPTPASHASCASSTTTRSTSRRRPPLS